MEEWRYSKIMGLLFLTLTVGMFDVYHTTADIDWLYMSGFCVLAAIVYFVSGMYLEGKDD